MDTADAKSLLGPIARFVHKISVRSYEAGTYHASGVNNHVDVALDVDVAYHDRVLVLSHCTVSFASFDLTLPR